MASIPGPTFNSGKIMLGRGDLSINGEKVAIRSATFSFANFNIRSPEIDGALGPIDGLMYYTEVTPQIETTILEPSKLMEVVETEGYVPPKVGDIVLTGHRIKDQTEASITLKRAVLWDAPSLEFPGDDDEATLDLTFVGTYDPENMSDHPYELDFGTTE